jgi:uncharacterized RDD family membrane protein YckC
MPPIVFLVWGYFCGRWAASRIGPAASVFIALASLISLVAAIFYGQAPFQFLSHEPIIQAVLLFLTALSIGLFLDGDNYEGIKVIFKRGEENLELISRGITAMKISEGNESELEYVRFWPRVGATAIDGILLLVITAPILTVFYGEQYWTSSPSASETFAMRGMLDFLLNWVFPAVAIMFFWTEKMATPGKMVIGAKIVDEKTGNAPSFGQFIKRYFAYFLSALPLGLGFIWVAIDRRKQGWHDKIAGTVVVRLKNRPPTPVTFK